MCSVPFHSEKLIALLSPSKTGILEKGSQDFIFIFLNLGLQALYLKVFFTPIFTKGLLYFVSV